MSVKVKYKGEQILSLNTDTEKALATEGQYCEGDIVVENVQDGGITPSGTLPINKNGTHDVTQYAEAEVNVPIPEGYIVPTGSKTITSNGEVDITNYAKVKVAIPSGSEVLF